MDENPIINNNEQTPPAKTPFNAARELFDWLESVLVALTAVVVALTFTARITVVDGDSMLPTLIDKQYLVISNLFFTPAHNDIIVLQANNIPNENDELGKPIVKRIIGVEGDVIDIDFEKGVVYRNGTALELEEKGSLIYEDGHMINNYTFVRESFDKAVTVPEGCVFVMGDNRGNSLDSRSSIVGMVDTHYVVGKVFWRIFPVNKFGSVY